MENIRNERLEQIRNEILTEEFARKADEVFAGRRSHDFLRSIGFLLHDMGNLYTSLRSNPSEKKEERKAEHSIEEMAKLVLLFVVIATVGAEFELFRFFVLRFFALFIFLIISVGF